MAVNGRVLFYATAGPFATGIWRTDGTETGTVFVASIKTFSPAIMLGNQLLFVASDGLVGEELWKTDGTAAGTMLVKDILPGPYGSSPRLFTLCGSNVFFVAYDTTHGNELWKTDGTTNGTMLVADINPDTVSPGPGRPISFNGQIYFYANDGAVGRIWKSDGTAGGTAPFAPELGLVPSSPVGVVGSNLFLIGCDSVSGCELWHTDGTTAGTQLVKDICPGPDCSGGPGFSFVALSNILVFFGFELDHGGEPWRTDGTAAGTFLIKDCRPGLSSSAPEGDFSIAFQNKAFFQASDGTTRCLWRSDGTGPGTTKVQTELGTLLRTPYEFRVLDGLLYFISGTNVWQSDGSDVGTRPILSSQTAYTVLSNVVYFNSSNAMSGEELWKMDTTPRPLLRGLRRSGPDITFEIVARANSITVLETSDDLQLWQPIRTNNVPDAGKFLHGEPRSSGQRFYRARHLADALP